MEHTGITGRTLAFLRGDVIDRHVEDVRKQNYNYLRSLSLLGLCTSAFTIAVGQAMGGVNGFDILFLLLFVYFVLVYALSDEFHQLFVPGRSGELRDVMIDTAAGVVGVCLAYLIHRKYVGRKS